MENKAQQITELRYTPHRQKMLKMLNNFGEIFNGPATDGRGLKILTPNQMLSRFPITLAQLKAGNNSEKLKNEIRQNYYILCTDQKNLQNNYKKV